MSEFAEHEGWPAVADRLSQRLARLTDRLAAALLLLLVFDVWLGVVARYLVPLPITFMEEAARYLMIWVALLAVSSCIPRREHIGVPLLFERLPPMARRLLLGCLDLIGVAFFVFLAFHGLALIEKGGQTFTMIYGTSKALPMAAVSVGAALATIQLVLVASRDQVRLSRDPRLMVCP